MILEKALESAVIAKVNSLGLASAWISGGWQSAAVGDIKTEPKDAMCIISINAKPRSYESYLAPTCEISVDIEMIIRDELAPTGAAVAEYAEPLFDLLQSWQTSILSSKSDLEVAGATIAGVRLDGGDTAHDFSSSRSTITQSVTVKCVINQTTNNGG